MTCMYVVLFFLVGKKNDPSEPAPLASKPIQLRRSNPLEVREKDKGILTHKEPLVGFDPMTLKS